MVTARNHYPCVDELDLQRGSQRPQSGIPAHRFDRLTVNFRVAHNTNRICLQRDVWAGRFWAMTEFSAKIASNFAMIDGTFPALPARALRMG